MTSFRFPSVTLAAAGTVMLVGCEGHASTVNARGDAGSVERSAGSDDTAAASHVARPNDRVPVVVELFSSEGCSSCPPADRLLARLATAQSIEGVDVIALELHVDYWNDLGWVDPFSDAAFSERQRGYAALGRRTGVFTPEAIVDGAASLVGSDSGALSDAIAQAARRPHVAVHVQRDADAASRLEAILGDGAEGASLWIAITESGLETAVPSGENGGHTLQHAPVVRALSRVGAAHPGTTRVAVPSVPAPRGPLDAIVLVQRDADHAILGADRVRVRSGDTGGL